MTAQAVSRQYRRLSFGDVSSTNTLAMEAARSGDPGNLWITAERQVEGRGRRGRAWISERGNLYASWLGIEVAPQAALAQLPFVASLAIRNTVARFVGSHAQTKWPNDVLAGGRKLVGILLESSRLVDGRTAMVMGCGINIEHKPEDAPYAVTSLRDEGYRGGSEPVFETLADEWSRQLERFARGSNFDDIRRDWLKDAVGVGLPCTVRLSDRTLEGTFERLERDGRLRLALADGSTMPISAGDIFFS
ncbi:biotin--[acetyl-CoA-carboxylase] ligase [Fulvimarina sp. 2208YS6-2-32]|uniref:biotin--[biotin carboxyl-carrier protein] ligase n=1 Tax=Fulvimarina uroteuthidis TaxID=3098149 RepID=A0ABU5I2D0_9HYPH|nr:biotin--[acetyl-CoA-carboxylase] ligase [Fulvimarina sp. 2208YS6-2-32]MDY8109507.1 biotin--[acetyl-CoA-carboxylase] ligase [Fulvimarina sp. 2208YS6-2-32]